MSLPVQCVKLSMVTEACLDLFGTGDGGPVAAGECFALDYSAVLEGARNENLPWHTWLLRRAVIGLWEEKPRRAAFVCYVASHGLIRLFYCAGHESYPEKFYAALASRLRDVETGRDHFAPETCRPLAWWEAPRDLAALWPSGPTGETDGARIVDAGNLAAWFSYPESDHPHATALDAAGGDYIRVPRQELEYFNNRGAIYHYLNRLTDVILDLGPVLEI